MIKRVFSTLAVIFFVLCMAPFAMAETARPEMLGTAYLVMDADTGQVLMEYNADSLQYPASITKIMTLALAAEKAQGNWNQTRMVTHEDVYSLENGSSHIALMENETVYLEDMMYAAEIVSANDAANVLISFAGDDGTIASGIAAMNAKAAELGLASTHYTNAHGLHNNDHYTTARDMANLTRWALTVPGFETVFCRTEMWTMAPTDLQPKERYFSLDDWMRLSGKYYRTYAKGSKTGFHDQARYTMVNYSEQDGVRLIAVVMGCPQRYDKFKDVCSLLDYCFEHYKRVEIPASAERFTAELMGGGNSLGQISVAPTTTSVLLHDDFTAADISATFDVPETYVLGVPFAATATYTLKENTLQPTTLLSESMKVSGVETLLAANTYIPQTSRTKADAGTNVWLFALVLALIPAAIVIVRKVTANAVKTSANAPKRNKYGVYEIPVMRPTAQPLPNASKKSTAQSQTRTITRRKTPTQK